MAKNPSKDKKVLKRGAWSAEEDEKLVAYIRRYGIWNWNNLPVYASLSRTGKSCRLRWLNYLRPGIKRGNITREEEEIIAKLHKIMGNRWAAIAARLPQRTDNEIKNYYNTRMKKRTQKEDVASMIEPPPESNKYQIKNLSDSATDSSSTMEENSSPVSHDVPHFNSSSHCQEVTAVRVKEEEEYDVNVNVGSFETYNYEFLTLPVEGLDLHDSFYVPLDDFFWASSFL